jgi:hypothetical protein
MLRVCSGTLAEFASFSSQKTFFDQRRQPRSLPQRGGYILDASEEPVYALGIHPLFLIMGLAKHASLAYGPVALRPAAWM